MRTVQTLLQEIVDELSFDPDLLRYKDSLQRRLNNKYAALAEKTPYSFFLRTDTLQLYATVSGENGVRVVASDLGNMRVVQTLDPSWLVSGWEGNATFIEANGTEHQIVYVDVAAGDIFLDEAPAAAITGTAGYGWTIVFRSYLLPSDAIQVLGYRDDRADDGWGKLMSIGRLTEENLFLDRDDTGRPQVVIEDDSRSRRAPFEAPTLAQVATGSLTQLRKFAYRYTIKNAGIESAPSPEAEITLTGANDQVNVTGFEDLRWGAGSDDSGARVMLYRRDLTARGPWILVAELRASVAAVTGFADTAMLPAYAVSWDDATYDNPSGTRQTARLYYRADEDRILSLRTWFRPKPLQGLTDVPLGPHALCNYLVASVMADLLSGSEAAKFEGRANEALASLDAYLSKRDERYRVQSWKVQRSDSDRPSPRDRNLGTPTFTP